LHADIRHSGPFDPGRKVPAQDPAARRWTTSGAERFRYLCATTPPGLWIIRRSKLSIELLV